MKPMAALFASLAGLAAILSMASALVLQSQVITATYTVTVTSPALTAQGAPSGAVATIPAGDWPVTTDLKFAKPVTIKLAAGARLYNGVAPAPIEPPPSDEVTPPIVPTPPPGPEGRKAWLRWEKPATDVKWIGVKYSSGGYNSPEMWLAPEGAQEIAVLAKPGGPFTATVRSIGVAGATSARVTGVWEIPTEGQPSPPTMTSTPATVIEAPKNPTLTIE
jgi:hypothetical protein